MFASDACVTGHIARGFDANPHGATSPDPDSTDHVGLLGTHDFKTAMRNYWREKDPVGQAAFMRNSTAGRRAANRAKRARLKN